MVPGCRLGLNHNMCIRAFSVLMGVLPWSFKKVMFESDMCISCFSEVFQYPILSQSSCLMEMMTSEILPLWNQLCGCLFCERKDPWSMLCISTFCGQLSHVPLALLPALAWTCWLIAHSKNLKFFKPPTTGTEFQLMCSSD